MATRCLWLWRPPWILAICLGLALIGPGLAGAGEKPKLVVCWKDLVQEDGLNPDPKKSRMTWNEHWTFWKKVQDTLRKKDPAKHGKLYGIGMTSSSRSRDTIYDFERYLLAYHGEVVTPEGKLVVNGPKNREAITKVLAFFTGIYKEGYVPPDTLTWTDADNNSVHIPDGQD